MAVRGVKRRSATTKRPKRAQGLHATTLRFALPLPGGPLSRLAPSPASRTAGVKGPPATALAAGAATFKGRVRMKDEPERGEDDHAQTIAEATARDSF